jgi:chemotaxis protein CheD
VGVAIYDAQEQRGAMAHIMLPSAADGARDSAPGKFADHAVPEMVRVLLLQGSSHTRLKAKIAGGAAMFQSDRAATGIGERNVAEVKRQLALLSVKLVAEDTGEAHARTVEFAPETGEFVVRSYKFGVRSL